MFQPVVESTQDIDILNLTMKIICESILENIYNKQIKFSMCAALNLLKDFEGIAEWIENNKQIPEAYREKLMKHEVLRYCEGVGKILLREPDEVISMFPSPTKAKRMSSNADEGNKNKRILFFLRCEICVSEKEVEILYVANNFQTTDMHRNW
jgi:hypothetical protein